MTNPPENYPPFDPNQPPIQPPVRPPYPPNPGGYYPPPPYPGFPPPMYVQPPPHPQSTTAMVLGIVGLVACGLASPFALWLGRKSQREIDASGGQVSGRGQAQAGFIMGLIGTALLALVVVLLLTGVLGAVLSSSP